MRRSKKEMRDILDKRTAILRYIKNKINDGQVFFKSHYIADDVGTGITSKFVGSFLYRLSKMKNSKLKITKNSKSNHKITWKIEREL